MAVQSVLAGLAVLISLVALTVSTTISWRQLRSMRSANHLPVAIELLTRDFGRDDFQQKERLVLRELPGADHQAGISGLPEPLLSAVIHVSSFYDSMGILIAFGTVDEELILGTINFRIRRVWDVLEPVIRAERKLRRSAYLDFLEDLACRAYATDPKRLNRALNLREMPPSAAAEPATSDIRAAGR